MAERKERSRLLILSRLCQFSLSREYGDGHVYRGLSDYAFRETRTPASGSLVTLQSAPDSKWYLSWVHSFGQKKGHCDITYTLESIEDGELCDWSNVSLLEFNRETTRQHPEWRWTDAQHEFNDRWRSVCYNDKDTYIVLPTPAEFDDEGNGVILGTRTRFGFDKITPSKHFADWRKVTKKMMAEWYDEACSIREAENKREDDLRNSTVSS